MTDKEGGSEEGREKGTWAETTPPARDRHPPARASHPTSGSLAPWDPRAVPAGN